jgi:hypothetical protein
MPDSRYIPHFYAFDYANFLTVRLTIKNCSKKGELVVVIKLHFSLSNPVKEQINQFLIFFQIKMGSMIT